MPLATATKIRALRRDFKTGAQPTAVQQIVGLVWWLTGHGFLLFGVLNFFTHIGLVLHTMPK